MKRYFVFSAVGGNRPGVVAQVSELIHDCGCSIEDSRMSLLGDHFALQILISGEDPGFSETLRERCGGLQKEKGIPVFLFPVQTHQEPGPGQPKVPNYEIRVVGRNQADVVYRTSALMASLEINIVDLETRATPHPEGGQTFTMGMQVAVPDSTDGKAFRRALGALADELRVEITLTRITKTG
jgi:glycine cleavage system transcriptional repressor